jgi:hypothetical protein
VAELGEVAVEGEELSNPKPLNSTTGDMRGERRGGVSLAEFDEVEDVSERSSPS